jgi:hypothetical protein
MLIIIIIIIIIKRNKPNNNIRSNRTLRSGKKITSLLQAKITRSGPTGKLRVALPDGSNWKGLILAWRRTDYFPEALCCICYKFTVFVDTFSYLLNYKATRRLWNLDLLLRVMAKAACELKAGKWIAVRMNDHLPSRNMSAAQLCTERDQRWWGYKSDVKLPPRLTEGLFGLNYFQAVELYTIGVIVCLFFMSRRLL